MHKKLMNRYEENTNKKLIAVCKRYGSHVFVKVRLADIFNITREKLSERQYNFSLKSHFDFLITNADLNPIFAVEFDGPEHQKQIQINRDRIKNIICKKYELQN